MPAKRLKQLAALLARRNRPVTEKAIAEFREVWPAALPEDYFDFLRIANGGTGEPGPLQLLVHFNKLQDVPADTAQYEAPKGVTLIGGDGMGMAYMFDTRRGRNAFVVADYTDFRPRQILGPTFEAFLEALIETHAAANSDTPAPARKTTASKTPARKRPAGKAPPVKASSPQSSALKTPRTPATAAGRKRSAPGKPAPAKPAAAPRAPAAEPEAPPLRIRLGNTPTLQPQLALSNDGRFAALVSLGCHLRVYELATGKAIVETALPGHFLTGLIFVPDSARLLAARAPGHDGVIPPTLIELPGGAPRLACGDRVVYGGPYEPARALFSADGARVALQCEQPGSRFTVSVRDVATGRHLLPPVPCDRAPIAFSADGSRLAARAPGGVCDLLLIDIASGAALTVPDATSDYLTLSADGALALVNRGDLRILDARTGKTLREIPLRVRGPRACRFIDRDRAVIATDTGTLHLYNARTGKELARYTMPRRPGELGLAVSPDGRWAIVCAETLRVLSVYRLPA